MQNEQTNDILVDVRFQDCTFFTSKEILRIFSRYQALAPDVVPYDMTGKEAQTVRIPHETVAAMPELKASIDTALLTFPRYCAA